MNLREPLKQCDLFFDWARKYPLLWQKVETCLFCIDFLADVASVSAYMQLRDSFHMLFIYANEGDFPHSAALFYERYEYCSSLLLPSFLDSWKGGV